MLLRFARDPRRGRQLQHGRPLAFAQTGDQHDLPIGKFQGVVMHVRAIHVDLPESSHLISKFTELHAREHAAKRMVALHLAIEALPSSPALMAAYPDPARRAQQAASGGEDYELLFTAAGSQTAQIRRLARRLGLRLTRIGEVRRGRGLRLGPGVREVTGFDHLVASAR